MCVVAFALLPIEHSHAVGAVKAEWNGFLRRSADRSDSTLTLSAGPRLYDPGESFETRLDVDAIVQVTDTKNLAVDRSAFTVESTSAYIATSKEFWSKHQLTLGRRIYDWSRFDDVWRFGTVSPRFIWDPTRPQTIGLTGVFYEYKSRYWRVLGYASPLSIPERGYPLRNESGKLLSSNPFFNPYYENAVIAKQNIPVRYSIDYPPTKDLILNSGGVVSVRHSSGEDGSGIWAQGLYGYLPVHQANLAIEASMPAQLGVIDVRIHPEIQSHHLLSFETGYTDSKYSVWVSQTVEKPTTRDVPTNSNWIATASGRSLISAFGGEVFVHPQWKLSGSFIYVNEADPIVVEQAQFSVELPGRFMFHRAAKLALAYQATDRMTYALGYLDDLEKESQLMSFDIIYAILKPDSALTLNLGSDFFASATGKGYIGQYKGNDRLRGGVSYAF